MEIAVEQFMDSFLEKVKLGIGYHTNHKLCDFGKKMETVNLGIVNRIVVRNILIQTSRKD